MNTKPTYYECGICGHYHNAWWDGDCRENEARTNPERLDDAFGKTGWDMIEMSDIEQWRDSHRSK